MRPSLALALAFLAPWIASCGKGPGGPSACTKPGVLRALGIQGEPAPGTAGNFGPFATNASMDVAAGGWATFVAATTDPFKPNALYVALPDGTVLLVWASGDPVPDAAGGTVDAVLRAWVNPSGVVLALVTIAGDAGGRTLGLLTARVDGGVVVEPHDVIYDGTSLVGVGLTGTLVDVDPLATDLVDDGQVFFKVSSSTGADGFLRAQRDGTGLSLLVGTGSALPGGLAVTSLRHARVNASGARYAFLCFRNDGGSTRGLYGGVPGVGAFGEIAAEGNPLPGGGTLGLIPDVHPFVVYEPDPGSVVFHVKDAVGDDRLILGAPGLPLVNLARKGQSAPGTGGTFGTIDLLVNESGAVMPMFRASLVGAAAGATFGIFGTVGGPPVLALWDGRDAPTDVGGGAKLTSTFPGLGDVLRTEVDVDGALAFANVLTTGEVGAFWLVRDCGYFTVALSGQAAPGGDVFSSATTWRQVAADDVVLLRAPLQTAGSGIFRQGP